LEAFARRYKAAGIDLRNKLHDQDGVRITWGDSEDTDTDWLAASTLAYDRLHAVDPTCLLIVGGLCWNSDLRAMAKRVGPVRAFNNRKLIYTVHVYPFWFWWRAEDDIISRVFAPVALVLCVLFLLAAASCFVFCAALRVARDTSSLTPASLSGSVWLPPLPWRWALRIFCFHFGWQFFFFYSAV